jgi:hypothetical protein
MRSCDKCLQIMTTNQWPAGLLPPLNVPSSLGKRRNIVTVIKQPMMKAWIDMIVNIIDALTKWVCLFTTREAELMTKKVSILFIDNYIKSGRILTLIVRNRNICFQSAFWNELSKA